MKINIRYARGEDAVMLTALSARTFYDAFAANNAPENIKAYMDEAFTLEKVTLELADPLAVFLLVEVDGEPAGYCKLSGDRAPECITGPSPMEIKRLYVEQKYLGTGVGPALMQASLDEALRRGHRTIYLGVWERNDRAVAFYLKWGFTKAGEQIFQMGADAQTDWLMERSLL